MIGHVGTGADGTFTARIPRGASRTITLAYRSFSLEPGYTTSVGVSELVRAGVLLSAAPARTSSQGRVTFSGRVLGAPAHGGVIVELLVRYRGRWQPIRTPRTGPAGRFRISYVFQGARGVFPFKVTVPGRTGGVPLRRRREPGAAGTRRLSCSGRQRPRQRVQRDHRRAAAGVQHPAEAAHRRDRNLAGDR